MLDTYHPPNPCQKPFLQEEGLVAATLNEQQSQQTQHSCSAIDDLCCWCEGPKVGWLLILAKHLIKGYLQCQSKPTAVMKASFKDHSSADRTTWHTQYTPRQRTAVRWRTLCNCLGMSADGGCRLLLPTASHNQQSRFKQTCSCWVAPHAPNHTLVTPGVLNCSLTRWLLAVKAAAL